MINSLKHTIYDQIYEHKIFPPYVIAYKTHQKDYGAPIVVEQTPLKKKQMFFFLMLLLTRSTAIL